MTQRYEFVEADGLPLDLVGPGTVLGEDAVEAGHKALIIGNPWASAHVVEGTPGQLREVAQRIEHLVQGDPQTPAADDHEAANPRATVPAAAAGSTGAQLLALAAQPRFQDSLVGMAVRMEIAKRHGSTPLTRTKTGLPCTLRFAAVLLTVDGRHVILPGDDGDTWLIPVEVDRPHERPPQIRYGTPTPHADARAALHAIGAADRA